MTGWKIADKDERNFDNTKRIERDMWKTERSKKLMVDRTMSSVKEVNNKSDE